MISPDALAGLAAQIITALVPAAPFLTKAGEAVASKIGADTWEQAKKLFELVRERFRQDKDQKGEQTLDLFVQDPETFESALAKLLLGSLQAHPEWANQVREIMAKPSLQEIVLKNKSHIDQVTQSLTGSGTQRIDLDDSTAGIIKQVKK